jgi:hypothetical protein
MNKAALPAILSVFAILFTCLGPAAATVDTEEAAKSIAIAFGRAMEWHHGLPSKAELRQSARGTTVWEVQFSDAARVEVDATTGTIVTVMDYMELKPLGELADKAGGEVPQNVSESAMRNVAQRALELAAPRDDLRFSRVSIDPVDKARDFVWDRVFNGIPYLSDGAGVSVSPLDGRLLGLGAHCPSAPPESAELNLSRETAIEVAQQKAAELGMSAAILAAASAQMYVVQPNNYWGPGPEADCRDPGAPSRVAWVVRLGDRGQKHFWIDAADGALLGGTQARDSSYTTRRLEPPKVEPFPSTDPRPSARARAAAPIIAAALVLLGTAAIVWSVRRKRPGT